MATEKVDKETVDKETKEALKSLGPLATLVGKSAGSLWKVFVRRYVAIGLGEAFAAAWVVWVSTWLLGTSTPLLLIPFGLAGLLGYLAILNLINPHYPALGDVVSRVQELNKPKPTEVVQAGAAFLRN